MKLLINAGRIAGTATDDYAGPDEHITAPEGFDAGRMGEYVIADGVASIPPPGVPTSVSPRQIRQALTRAGLRASVELAVAAGDQDTKDWYEFATAFERASPIVAALGAALDVSPLQLDELWILAGSL